MVEGKWGKRGKRVEGVNELERDQGTKRVRGVGREECMGLKDQRRSKDYREWEGVRGAYEAWGLKGVKGVEGDVGVEVKMGKTI